MQPPGAFQVADNMLAPHMLYPKCTVEHLEQAPLNLKVQLYKLLSWERERAIAPLQLLFDTKYIYSRVKMLGPPSTLTRFWN